MSDVTQVDAGEYFDGWAKVYLRIGLNADLKDIDWNRMHRTSVSKRGLNAKKKLLEDLEGNLGKLEAYVGRSKPQGDYLHACRSMYRQYREARNQVLGQINYLTDWLSPTELISE